MHPLLKLVQLRWTSHVARMPDERLQECLIKRSSTENFSLGNAPKVARRNAMKTSKSLLDGFQHTTHRSPGNRLHRIERSGIASSEREQMAMKQREAAKWDESAQSQSQGITISVVIFRIDMLYLQQTV